MTSPKGKRSYRLPTFLGFLLVATISITMALVGGALLAYRIPQITAEAQASVEQEAKDKALLLEFLLGGLESQLWPIAALAQTSDHDALDKALETIIGNGFNAIYVVDKEGIIRSGSLGNDIGDDLSRNSLFLASQAGKAVWSDKYLSAQTGNIVVGVALRHGA